MREEKKEAAELERKSQEQKEREKANDIRIDKYSLILFDFDKFDKLANIYDVYHNSHRETNKHNQLTVDNINNNVSIKNMVIDDDLGDVAFTTTLS